MRTEPNPLQVKEGYDRWSKIYDQDANPLLALEEPVVHNWMTDVRGLRVADVGCGTGRHTLWLARQGATVDGYDGSPGMLSAAQAKLENLSAELHPHNLPEPLPCPAETYDVVVFALVADHVNALEVVFGDLHRATRCGGTLIFTVMHPAMNLKGVQARFEDPEHGRRIEIESCSHRCSDYVLAVLRSGWSIQDMIERQADPQLAAQAPRAAKYLGWPMLLAMRLQKPAR